MKVSFCTTCMGRAYHLKQTLPANLASNADYPAVEFVVLDYNSKDDLEGWMREMLPSVPPGRVAYFRERTAKFFDPRHAKNVAHLLATGDVVVNLDADNFTGPGYAAKLADHFKASPKSCVVTTSTTTSLAGKIALTKASFSSLRGYDESLTGWGAEDPDLIARARRSGLPPVKLLWPGESVIDHSEEERVCNFDMGGKSRFQTNDANWERIKARPVTEVVNKGGYGSASVLVGLSSEIRLAGAAGVP